jgi:protein involved in polysaccharide export with SLBB domain
MRRFLLLALLSGLAACGTRGDQRPFEATEPIVIPEWEPVSPEIDSWFRGTRPTEPDRLIVDDAIEIRIQGRPEYTVQSVLPTSGMVPLFKAASVPALGRTPLELEQAIAEAYSAEFTAPYVTVSVLTRAPRYVYVSGEVEKEQRVAMIGEGLNVMKAITLAGGATSDADLRHVTIRRFHPELQEEVRSPVLDIASVYAGRSQSDNLYLAPGDTLILPKSTQYRVHVFGHVEKPGAVGWIDGLTLSMALTECGGLKRFARISRVSIVRAGNKAFLFDFDAVVSGETPDLMLQPGDRVFVPESPL